MEICSVQLGFVYVCMCVANRSGKGGYTACVWTHLLLWNPFISQLLVRCIYLCG